MKDYQDARNLGPQHWKTCLKYICSIMSEKLRKYNVLIQLSNI